VIQRKLWDPLFKLPIAGLCEWLKRVCQTPRVKHNGHGALIEKRSLDDQCVSLSGLRPKSPPFISRARRSFVPASEFELVLRDGPARLGPFIRDA